ncbi:hypothetical protein [Halococcus sp. AFM35]|uniref:hypothetical protein n=1 Tax=Halococcus sp. AFM35 TaxID=3421653 RepID=UPI003EC14BB4
MYLLRRDTTDSSVAAALFRGASIVLAFVEDSRAVVLALVAVIVGSSVVVWSSVSVVCCMVGPKPADWVVSARPRAADRYRTVRA